MAHTYEYPRPMVCTDCMVVAGKKILLIKRKNEPFAGLWALPGGFVEMDEDLEASARRELQEETGIRLPTLTQFAAYGKPGRDPRGRTISIVYYFISENEIKTTAGDDASEARWFALDHLPELAFDHHQIISDFLSRI